jgi:hypothetical protein
LEFQVALDAYDALSDEQKLIYVRPSLYNFDLDEYLEYLPDDVADEFDEEAQEAQDLYVLATAAEATENSKAVLFRLFCKINVLFFADIAIG